MASICAELDVPYLSLLATFRAAFVSQPYYDFDAHWRDPLANLNLTEADFAWATKRLMDLADRHCAGRVVSVLEGGYDLEGLAKSAAAHVDSLMGR